MLLESSYVATKRLGIKDIKKTINRLDELEEINKKELKSNSLHESHNKNSNSNPNLKPKDLKYMIIKNMLLEKFKERQIRKKEKNHDKFKIRPGTPKIIQSFMDVDEEFVEKIRNKNINHLDPNHKFFYLSSNKKLSDGSLLRQTRPLLMDSSKESLKRMREDNKAKNIIYSNLKYDIDLTSDEYIRSLNKFKNLSKEYNKKIILKEKLGKPIKTKNRFSLRLNLDRQSILTNSISSVNHFRNSSLPQIHESEKRAINFWDYMHYSLILNKHKDGSNRLPDTIISEKLNMDEIKNNCGRHRKHNEHIKSFHVINESVNNGKIKRLSNCSFRDLKINQKPLVRDKYLSVNLEELPNHEKNDFDDSLESVTESKLDNLYNESQILQKKLKNRENITMAERMKKIIKLENLNK